MKDVKEGSADKGGGSTDEAKAAGAAKPSGLSSGNIFGGGGGGGSMSGWKARQQERELKAREQALSVDNAASFPSLADAVSG